MKKDEIIDAASYLFSEKGYELAMSEIAEIVGIKTPSLYSHFSGKEEIMRLAIEKELRQFYCFLSQTAEEAKTANTEQRLKRIYLSVFEYFDKPGKLDIWKRIPFIYSDSLREKCIEAIRDQENMLSVKIGKIMEEGVRSGEVRENLNCGAQLLFLMMAQGLLDDKLLSRKTASEMEEFMQLTWETYWNGVKRIKQ